MRNQLRSLESNRPPPTDLDALTTVIRSLAPEA
jgi:hypothetical protein